MLRVAVLLWFAARACLQLVPERPLLSNSRVTTKWLLRIDPERYGTINTGNSHTLHDNDALGNSSGSDRGEPPPQPTEAELLRYAHMGILSSLPNGAVLAVFQVLLED